MTDPLLNALRNEKQARAFQQKTERDARMLMLWDRGFDTFAIAKDVHLHEAIVASTLWRLREERRAA